MTTLFNFAQFSWEVMRLRTTVLVLTVCLSITSIAQRVPVSTTSKAARAMYEKGLNLSDQHFHKEAAEAFRQAWCIDPGFVMARIMFVYRGGATNAAAELKQVAESAPKVTPAEQKFLAAATAEYTGNKGEARRLLEELVKEYPDDVEARNHLGVLYYFGFNDYVQAEEMWREGYRRNPNKVNPLNNLGYALRAQGKLKEAEAAFKEAVEKFPGQVNTYDSLGDLYLAMQRYDEAIEQYTASASLDAAYSKNDLVRAKVGKTKQLLLTLTDLRDSASVTKLFTPSARILLPQNKTVKGTAEVTQYWQTETSKGTTSLALTPDETRFADDWAYEAGKYIQSSKGKAASREGNYSIVWINTSGGWRINYMMVN